MHALFFELTPRPGHESHYFERAAALRPVLEQNKGLLFIDRFKSMARPEVILSHSLWKDEASLAKWRTNAQHHAAQTAGRNVHFSDYRLRIAQVIASAAPGEETQCWPESNAYNDTSLTPERHLVVVQSNREPFDCQGEAFSSVNRENAFVSVVSVDSRSQGDELLTAAGASDTVETAKLCLISRDYGMYEREEAPQFFPMKNSEQESGGSFEDPAR